MPAVHPSSGSPRIEQEEEEDDRPLLSHPEPARPSSRGQRNDLDESSPLLEPRKIGEDETLLNEDTHLDLEWQEEAFDETKSTWYLLILTLSIGG